MSTRLWRGSWREAKQRQTTRWKTILVTMMMIDDNYNDKNDDYNGKYDNYDDNYDDADRIVRILIKVENLLLPNLVLSHNSDPENGKGMK